MRVVVLALTIVLAPAVALAGTDIVASCYKDCENATHSNPEYKACLARAADKADAALNQAYKTLQDKIRAAAKDMGQPADTHSSQKYWITFRDANGRQSRLRRHGDRRQLLVLPVRAEL
jgi:uncharacterized protein YecT (DUF1311 family)